MTVVRIVRSGVLARSSAGADRRRTSSAAINAAAELPRSQTNLSCPVSASDHVTARISADAVVADDVTRSCHESGAVARECQKASEIRCPRKANAAVKKRRDNDYFSSWY